MRLRFLAILILFASTANAVDTDWAPHDCVTRSSHLAFQILASSRFSGSFDEYKACDGLIANGNTWISSGAPPQWLRYQIATGDKLILNSYTVQVNTQPDPNRAPKDWTMEGSNDGSSWATLDTVTSQTAWGSGEARNFVCDVTTTAYSYFRLNISANNGDGLVQTAELFLYSTAPTFTAEVGPHNMTSNTVPAPFVAAAATHFSPTSDAFAVFSGTGEGVGWIGTGIGTDWLSLDFGSGILKRITAYTLSVQFQGLNLTRWPKDWTFEGSNNGSSWTTVDTRTSQTGWYSVNSVGEHRTFAVATPGSYRYYRINISANNGDATNNEFTDMYLWGTAGVVNRSHVFVAM